MCDSYKRETLPSFSKPYSQSKKWLQGPFLESYPVSIALSRTNAVVRQSYSVVSYTKSKQSYVYNDAQGSDDPHSNPPPPPPSYPTFKFVWDSVSLKQNTFSLAYQLIFFDIHTTSAIQLLQSHVLKANFAYKICRYLKHKFGTRNQRNPGEIAS